MQVEVTFEPVEGGVGDNQQHAWARTSTSPIVASLRCCLATQRSKSQGVLGFQSVVVDCFFWFAKERRQAVVVGTQMLFALVFSMKDLSQRRFKTDGGLASIAILRAVRCPRKDDNYLKNSPAGECRAHGIAGWAAVLAVCEQIGDYRQSLE